MKLLTSLTIAVITFNFAAVKHLAPMEAGLVNFGGMINDFKVPKGASALDIAEGIENLYEEGEYADFDSFYSTTD